MALDVLQCDLDHCPFSTPTERQKSFGTLLFSDSANATSLATPSLAIVVGTWILLPGAALLPGTLPFLRPRGHGTGSVAS